MNEAVFDENRSTHGVYGFYRATFTPRMSSISESAAGTFSLSTEPFVRAVRPSCNYKLHCPEMGILEDGVVRVTEYCGDLPIRVSLEWWLEFSGVFITH